MTGVAAISVDKFGRKPLLLLSGLGSCLSIITLGVFFYLDENKMCIYDAEIQTPLVFNQSKLHNSNHICFKCQHMYFYRYFISLKILPLFLWIKCVFQIQTLIQKLSKVLAGYQ